MFWTFHMFKKIKAEHVKQRHERCKTDLKWKSRQENTSKMKNTVMGLTTEKILMKKIQWTWRHTKYTRMKTEMIEDFSPAMMQARRKKNGVTTLKY